MCVFNTPNQASDWLKQGKLLAYPTESVWGLGCDAMNEYAVGQILQIKNRSIEKGLIVVTDSSERIEPLLKNLNPQQKQIIIDSWTKKNQANNKQAITWLLPIDNKQNFIPKWITGKHNSVAVRVIANPQIQQVCQSLVSETNPFGLLVSTSCNIANLSPAKNLQQAQNYFSTNKNVAYLRGETLSYALPSQIKNAIDLTVLR